MCHLHLSRVKSTSDTLTVSPLIHVRTSRCSFNCQPGHSRAGTSNQRRSKVKTGTKSNDGCLHLTDLPPESLSFISSYLSKPSVALFAVASTASSSSSSWRKCNRMVQPSPIISKAILSSEQCWEVLDFVDIEKDLAKRLTDDDLGALLSCTDAVHKLKRLHLTGLLRIVGDGLESLRGSVRMQ